MGWVIAPAMMPPMAPMTRLTRLGWIASVKEVDPAENTAEMMVKGSRSTDEATITMMKASSRMPNTRQKLLRTSRQDRASAWRGPRRSSTTAAAVMLNMAQNQTSITAEAMAPMTPTMTSSAAGAPATPSRSSRMMSPTQGPM